MEKIYKGEIQRLLPIFQAMAEGRTIQFSANGNSWIDIDGDEEGLFLDTLIATPQRYRIKPELKYRSFKNTEECWAEMQKHQPFGWVINKNTGRKYCITAIHETSNEVFIADDTWKDFLKIKKNYTFTDGTPFGVKVEE